MQIIPIDAHLVGEDDSVGYNKGKSDESKSFLCAITTSSYMSIIISSEYCPIIDSFSIPLILLIISLMKSTPAP